MLGDLKRREDQVEALSRAVLAWAEEANCWAKEAVGDFPLGEEEGFRQEAVGDSPWAEVEDFLQYWATALVAEGQSMRHSQNCCCYEAAEGAGECVPELLVLYS